jgi:predicted DNA-binding transcriptional regulator AlpA
MVENPTLLKNLMTEKDAAKVLSVSVHWMRKRRNRKQPPKFYRIGRVVRYRHADLETFLQSCPTGGVEIVDAESLAAIGNGGSNGQAS